VEKKDDPFTDRGGGRHYFCKSRQLRDFPVRQSQAKMMPAPTLRRDKNSKVNLTL